MEKIVVDNFEVKKFIGGINISKDIFDNFNLPSNLIFRQKNEKEMILFSEEKWNRFFNEMKKESGFTQSQLEWTEKGRNFIRYLCSRGINVYLNKSGKIIFPKNSYLKRKLNGNKFNIKLCV